MNDDVIPLNKIGKIETVKVYNQSYVNKQQKRIAELEEKISILLSCKSCPENKGGLLCQKEYEGKCLSQKTQYIKELKEENAELKSECRTCIYTDTPCVLSDYEKSDNGTCSHYKNVFEENEVLKEQIEKLKSYANVSLPNDTCYKCGKELSLENRASVILTSNPPKYLCKECAGEKEVEKHKWNDILLGNGADYDKKIAEEYTTLQERITNLEKENAELKEQNSRTKEFLTKVMRNTWSIDSNVVNEINKFLKESKE